MVWPKTEGLREEWWCVEVSWVVLEWFFESGEEWRGCGRKKKEKMRDMRGCRGGRQAQMMETLLSSEDQTAALAFVFVKSRPRTMVDNS